MICLVEFKHMAKSGSDTFFIKMVDDMVDLGEYDPELLSGLQWLDEQGRKKNMNLYDMVFDVLYRHDIKEKAENWLRNRN